VQLLKITSEKQVISDPMLDKYPENERNVELCDGSEILGRDY